MAQKLDWNRSTTQKSMATTTTPEAIGIMAGGEQNEKEGTGAGFGQILLVLTGVSSLIACLLTLLSVILQVKNYRKPLLQRHVVRILVLVPIFSIASWASLTSLRVAFYIDPFRDAGVG